MFETSVGLSRILVWMGFCLAGAIVSVMGLVFLVSTRQARVVKDRLEYFEKQRFPADSFR